MRLSRLPDDVVSWFAHRANWTAWIVVVAIPLGVMLYAATASAATVTGPWYAQRAIDESHAPVPPGQTVLLGPCPGYADAAACNFVTPDSPIYIDLPTWANGVDLGPLFRGLLYRELGGRFDTLAMTPAARWHFMAIMRYRGAWWASGDGTGLIERFEDAYADCAYGIQPRRETLQRPDDRWEDSFGYDPKVQQHRRVCALIARMGARAGYQTPALSTG